MNKYICTGCGEPVEGDLPPSCPKCQATDKFVEVKEPTSQKEAKPAAPETTKNIGIRANPQLLIQIMKLVSLPSKGSKPYAGFQRTFFNIDEKKGTLTNYQVAPGEVILTVLEVQKGYFNELWGSGILPIKTTESLERLSVLSNYNDASIQADTENKVLIHNAGESAKFASNLEGHEHITTAKEFLILPKENSDNGIFRNFDMDNFLPIFSEGMAYDHYVTVDIAELVLLQTIASSHGIKYYPFRLLPNGELRAGVGDVTNPGTSGAFDLDITINKEKSKLPSTNITVEVGSVMENVINNLSGEVKIYFAGDGLPLWIVSDITKKTNVKDGDKTTIEVKTFGKVGYVVTPRVPDE